jgi:1-acyl-sn-glycerol-3-phosphate acyltransferase
VTASVAQKRGRATRGPLGPWYALAVVILKPILTLLTRRRWTGIEHIPASGGAIIVPNHVSHADPLTTAHFVYDAGRLPRFLAKSELFGVFFVRSVLRGARQIPVFRESGTASQAYRAAVDAVRNGELVVIYPEATLTRDPGLWPMVGKTGAARVALETGAPVIPVAQWGVQEILPPYAKVPHLLPRHLVQVTAGPPVPLDDLRGRPIDQDLLRIAAERIMAAVTTLLADLRGESAPEIRFDPKSAGLPRTGNPRRLRTGEEGA